MSNLKLKSLIMLLSLTLIYSCGNKTKTEIPEILTKNEVTNKATKEYFETLEEVIDQYVIMSEKIIETGKEVEEKNGEPSFTDVMNMAKTITSSTMELAPFLEKMEELEEEAEILKEDMTVEEMEAFSKTYMKIMVRFHELSNNY